MMGWSLECYIHVPSFVEIGLPVPEKKIFEGFYHIRVILVICPASCHQIFISLYLKAFIQNLVQIVTVVSEKNQFEFLSVHNLGPRSRYDLDLQHSHIFINSISCLHPQTFKVMTMTFNTHISSYIQLDVHVFSYYLSGHWLQ